MGAPPDLRDRLVQVGHRQPVSSPRRGWRRRGAGAEGVLTRRAKAVRQRAIATPVRSRHRKRGWCGWASRQNLAQAAGSSAEADVVLGESPPARVPALAGNGGPAPRPQGRGAEPSTTVDASASPRLKQEAPGESLHPSRDVERALPEERPLRSTSDRPVRPWSSATPMPSSHRGPPRTSPRPGTCRHSASRTRPCRRRPARHRRRGRRGA
jgi:hypothetical protein